MEKFLAVFAFLQNLVPVKNTCLWTHEEWGEYDYKYSHPKNDAISHEVTRQQKELAAKVYKIDWLNYCYGMKLYGRSHLVLFIRAKIGSRFLVSGKKMWNTLNSDWYQATWSIYTIILFLFYIIKISMPFKSYWFYGFKNWYGQRTRKALNF